MEEPKVWYFAYGSNMDSERFEGRICRNNIIWTTGKLNNYELVFNKIAGDGSGYANIQSGERKIVYGVLYLLSERELQELDKYEGVPAHYRRMELNVETEEGEVRAFCYIAVENNIKEGLIPKCGYLKYLINGAREHNLPGFYVQELERIRCL